MDTSNTIPTFTITFPTPEPTQQPQDPDESVSPDEVYDRVLRTMEASQRLQEALGLPEETPESSAEPEDENMKDSAMPDLCLEQDSENQNDVPSASSLTPNQGHYESHARDHEQKPHPFSMNGRVALAFDVTTGSGMREFFTEKKYSSETRKRECSSISFYNLADDEKLLGSWGRDVHTGERVEVYEVKLQDKLVSFETGDTLTRQQPWICFLISRPIISVSSTNTTSKNPPPTSWVMLACPLTNIKTYPTHMEIAPQHQPARDPLLEEVRNELGIETDGPYTTIVKSNRYLFSRLLPIFEFSQNDGDGDADYEMGEGDECLGVDEAQCLDNKSRAVDLDEDSWANIKYVMVKQECLVVVSWDEALPVEEDSDKQMEVDNDKENMETVFDIHEDADCVEDDDHPGLQDPIFRGESIEGGKVMGRGLGLHFLTAVAGLEEFEKGHSETDTHSEAQLESGDEEMCLDGDEV